ncbi:hypothetical protein AA0119_g12017 [Alternaria tenuissima]|uniref:Uncharacterized protein n=1 Tax=Alternaria tenuissima TaxID=119927 RepID=A0A4Q4QY61_9PLEO|nr:hypothetical protein AA0115_g11979 [Alternaria tenuissima]RYN88241.1 hypothetical protein AA0119_g12017 [Alternaria tenuissima]RYO06437.1 hypothetical protein AA0121_g12091 [Alternaria tenuissima]RYO48715.1 hypothetical protein AA0116_g12555 [Alternaria tenuissima]
MKLLVFAPVLLALAHAAPVAQPANFEADAMLAVARSPESSYANKRGERAHFEADAMLAVARAPKSSYAEKRAKFEADAMLAVARDSESSYAK